MITHRSIVPLWVMAQIPTIWEIKGSESAIFGFPWFKPCLVMIVYIPDLVDFHLEGAEILKVENHKGEALLKNLGFLVYLKRPTPEFGALWIC